ncbi:predicted protein [Lichtheimia corymbifera JMRC:FSU:9682]|uniref:Uncharacterized protein n=1 Tax=Lichtheimia corymbifera JMRC:FSU:9682 TaxID=1263082 RepID=A0A068RZX3_9FUNG|nr:predicted protein [Lichtheimia corymbifera JMRC:FSU:9682]
MLPAKAVTPSFLGDSYVDKLQSRVAMRVYCCIPTAALEYLSFATHVEAAVDPKHMLSNPHPDELLLYFAVACWCIRVKSSAELNAVSPL